MGLAAPLNGCGREAVFPNQLPNRMVPPDQTVEQAITARAKQQKTKSNANTKTKSKKTAVPADTVSDHAVTKSETTSPPQIQSATTKKVLEQSQKLHSPLTPTSNIVSRARLTLPPPLVLGAKALELATLTRKEYLKLQQKWVGSAIPACNYFLITALCEAGYCENAKPFFRAANFDQYFIKAGWKITTLDQLREKARKGEPMDVVFQKAGPSKTEPGHVMVFVRYLIEDGLITIAEGDLDRATNETFDLPEDSILTWQGGYTIFIKQ